MSFSLAVFVAGVIGLTGSPSSCSESTCHRVVAFLYRSCHCIVSGLMIEVSRWLFAVSPSVRVLMMLIDVVGVVPERDGRPFTFRNDLEHDRVAQRWR